MTFETLGLHSCIIKALIQANYTRPTPVQEQTIPTAIAGNDLLVSSQTGSGKTAAFMLPALHKFILNPSLSPKTILNNTTSRQDKRSIRTYNDYKNSRTAQPKMLVLTPTRELALQVTTATGKYCTHIKHLKTVSILGGMPYPKQMQLLSRNPEILIATPGRLIDHMNSGKINFSKLQILVLDEADRMLDMGFIEDIEKIVAATPITRQTMLFSATLDGIVGNIAKRITKNPKVIQIAKSSTKHENITQYAYFVDDLSHKNRLLDYFLKNLEIDQALVFTATKRDADTVSHRLNTAGFSTAALHGDMHQGARNRTLENLRRHNIQILVATDIAARGIDIPRITHVFNYDLPKFPEDYIHRIGRTGRAGRNGIAISLVNYTESINIKRIERFTKQLIPINTIKGYEPKKPPISLRNRSYTKNKPIQRKHHTNSRITKNIYNTNSNHTHKPRKATNSSSTSSGNNIYRRNTTRHMQDTTYRRSY